MESIMTGREGREGAWKDRHERKKHAGGLRNDQAAKNKPYLMVKGSWKVRSKLRQDVGRRNIAQKRDKKLQRGKKARGSS
mmetsp:Transcript_8411/g.13273  ORF Transcript_8411/g.13273 Transcript_8411/m.13273 type:complete len:80 (-) Transcript_8411:57-296(-)